MLTGFVCVHAECELVGTETTCWCATNYIWSDLVCDTMTACCNVLQCVANISDFTPLCVPQVNGKLAAHVLPGKNWKKNTKVIFFTFQTVLCLFLCSYHFRNNHDVTVYRPSSNSNYETFFFLPMVKCLCLKLSFKGKHNHTEYQDLLVQIQFSQKYTLFDSKPLQYKQILTLSFFHSFQLQTAFRQLNGFNSLTATQTST